MRRLGAVAAVGAGLVVLALAATLRSAGAASDGATVTGHVKLTGKAPANPPIDMGEEPKCKAKYTTTPVDPAVVVGKTGTLANVFVYVKTGLPADAKFPAPSTPVEIDQNGCLYHPRVFGIMVGQGLAIKNSDGVLHNIKALGKKNRPFNISQPTTMVTQRPGFTVQEVMLPFECNVHGWMHAFAGVLPHPFFATTGEDGAFSLKGLPAGTYTIEAWHEKYGVQTATVTVKAGETKPADFTFTAK
jgi:plastocyanin